ncbi:MAG: 4-hydroxy-tetrahydrodipicolinate synthase [Candidatus Altiarchaeota archaeon]
MKLKGAFTAIVTPFKENGDLDEEGLRANIDFQIEKGINGLVPCGTTGESPTLTTAEHISVVELVIDQANGRVPVLAGTGSNSTAEAVNLTKHALDAGADGALVITPYYNKPTQEGLFWHYKKISESVDIPIVLYTVPGRTNVNLLPETTERIMAACPNIFGLKEATGDMDQIRKEAEIEGLTLISGDDALTLDIIGVGGKGVISVASNIIPQKVSEFVSKALAGDKQAERMHDELLPLFKVLFVETSPSPVKYAMNVMGLTAGPVRLPLVEPQPESKEKIEAVLKEQGLL